MAKALKIMQCNRPLWLDACFAFLKRHGFVLKEAFIVEKRKLLRDNWKPKSWNRKLW